MGPGFGRLHSQANHCVTRSKSPAQQLVRIFRRSASRPRWTERPRGSDIRAPCLFSIRSSHVGCGVFAGRLPFGLYASHCPGFAAHPQRSRRPKPEGARAAGNAILVLVRQSRWHVSIVMLQREMMPHAPASHGVWPGQNPLQMAKLACELRGQASPVRRVGDLAAGQKVRPPTQAQNRFCALNHRRTKSRAHKCRVSEMILPGGSDVSYAHSTPMEQ